MQTWSLQYTSSLPLRRSGSKLPALREVRGTGDDAQQLSATSSDNEPSEVLRAMRGLLSRQRRPAEESSAQQTAASLLQPSMRRAMRVVAHPDVFYTGYASAQPAGRAVHQQRRLPEQPAVCCTVL